MMETLKEKLYALEKFHERFVARENIPHCLSQMLCEWTPEERGNQLTPRSTPMPVKSAFAGEKG